MILPSPSNYPTSRYISQSGKLKFGELNSLGPQYTELLPSRELRFGPRRNSSAQAPKQHTTVPPESLYCHTEGVGGDPMSQYAAGSLGQEKTSRTPAGETISAWREWGQDNWNSSYCPTGFHLGAMPTPSGSSDTHRGTPVIPSPHPAVFLYT